MNALLHLALLPVFLTNGGSAAAQAATSPPRSLFEAEHSQLAATAVAELERMADWCHEKRLYRQRDAAFRSILQFAPDHLEARKFLKFRRAKGGQWAASGSYREPSERESPDLPEFQQMREDLIADLSRQVFELLERHQGCVLDSDRHALFDGLLALDPDHGGVHAELGEVRDPSDSAWILVESAATRKRRAELAQAAVQLVKAGPRIEAAAPDQSERELGLEWRSVLRTERVRILSTVPGNPPAECARLAEAAIGLFDAALRPDAHCGAGFRIYLLGSPSEKTRLLAQHPAVGPARAAELRPFDSFWLPGRNELVVCSEALNVQLDLVVIQAITRKLCDHFGVGTREGFLHAGVTSYLSGLVRAARLGESESAAAGRGREALDRLDVELTLGKPVQELSKEEQAAGRVLAGYLIEGWPESAPYLLGRVGSGARLDQALHDILGFDLATLLERLERRDREIR